MDIFENFSALFVEVWEKGILGVDIFQILIGLGIFLVFLLFRGLISKIIINRLKKMAKKTFYLYSSEGDTKEVNCDDTEQFMTVLKLVRATCPEERLVYAEPLSGKIDF